MPALAGVLSQLMGRKVVDKTGLGGRFNFNLDYARDRDSGAADLPDSVFTAIREQLGLDLAARKGQVEFVIIERLERLIPN